MRRLRRAALLVAISALATVVPTAPAGADSLYLSDMASSAVQSFDATGNSLGTFISPPLKAAPLTTPTGPAGILHLRDGTFLVAYQNPGLPIPGEIDQFASDGTFLRTLVPSTDSSGQSNPNAPFAPRGMILGPDNRTLYVADFGPDGEHTIGAVKTYDVATGDFLGDLNFDSFINSSASNDEFHPRGLAFAPDRRSLYLTLFSEQDFVDRGWILRYDIKTGDVGLLATWDPNAAPSDCHLYLHRPDGLAIGPDQKIYVIGRATSIADKATDKVLVFNRTTGACRPWIDLDQPRAGSKSYARALLFGPGGKLYLPMAALLDPTGPTGTDAGGVRAYDLHAHPVTYTEFVSPTAVLGAQWFYLTFGRTDPTTLTYQPPS